MMTKVHYTLAQQFLLDFLAPPILAGLWWLYSRGWARTVQGDTVSDETIGRQAKGFWIVLVLLYLVAFGGTVYFNSID
jgi:hypothetical protein